MIALIPPAHPHSAAGGPYTSSFSHLTASPTFSPSFFQPHSPSSSVPMFHPHDSNPQPSSSSSPSHHTHTHSHSHAPHPPSQPFCSHTHTHSHPSYCHPSGTIFTQLSPPHPPAASPYAVHLPPSSAMPSYGSYPNLPPATTYLPTQPFSPYTTSPLLTPSPSPSPPQPVLLAHPHHHLHAPQQPPPTYWTATTSPQLTSASAPTVMYEVTAVGAGFAGGRSPVPHYHQHQPQDPLLQQHPHRHATQGQPHYHVTAGGQAYSATLLPPTTHRMHSAPPQFYTPYAPSAPAPPPGYYYHSTPVEYSSGAVTSAVGPPPAVWMPTSPSSTASFSTPPSSHLHHHANHSHPTTPPPIPLPATCLASEYHSIIECGGIDPTCPPRRRLTHYVDYFGREVEFYTATTDPSRSILYRVSTLAHKIDCATNKVGMYLARRKTSGGGIYQATGFLYKPPGRVGLKAGGYFLSLAACREFEAHFAPTAVDEVRTAHSRDSDGGTSNSSGERSLIDAAGQEDMNEVEMQGTPE